MREYKFRAWDATAKDMVYFGLGEDNFSTYCEEDRQCYTLLLEHKPPVMQYAGLKDKYGTELYEDDIVHVHNETETRTGHNSRVWITPDGVKIEPHIAHKKLIGINSRSLCSYIEFEIIGNIYQNPELLAP